MWASMVAMITILCATGTFGRSGFVDCRHCHHRTVFPSACEIVLLIINDINVIYEASTGAIMHDCRHVRVLEDPVMTRRGSRFTGAQMTHVTP